MPSRASRFAVRVAVAATIVSLVALPAATASAQNARGRATAGASARLREEITQANRAMEAALGRGDIKAVAAFYADDGRITGPRGFEVKGRAAIDKYWADVRDPKSWKLEVFEVGGSADDAYQVGRSTLVHGATGAERTSVVDFVLVWRRGADGRLRIAHDFYR